MRVRGSVGMMTRTAFLGLFIIFHWDKHGKVAVHEAHKAWMAWQSYDREQELLRGRKGGA